LEFVETLKKKAKIKEPIKGQLEGSFQETLEATLRKEWPKRPNLKILIPNKTRKKVDK